MAGEPTPGLGRVADNQGSDLGLSVAAKKAGKADSRHVTCEHCSGVGDISFDDMDGTTTQTCGTCLGTGTVKDETPMERLCLLPCGSHLYREPNGAGGHTYYSFEIGGGIVAWDTSLINRSTLLAALFEEEKRVIDEQRQKNHRR